MSFFIPTVANISGVLAINEGSGKGYSNRMEIIGTDARADVGKICFKPEGWTRLIEFKDGGQPTPYFSILENTENKIKFRSLDGVPNGVWAQSIAYVGIQPRKSNRQVTINAKGLVSSKTPGAGLMLWQNIPSKSTTTGKQYYWKSNSFEKVNYTNNNTGETGILGGRIESDYFHDPDDIENASDLGIFMQATPRIYTLPPRPCPLIFALSCNNEPTQNINGIGYIEVEITLDS